MKLLATIEKPTNIGEQEGDEGLQLLRVRL